MAVKRCCRCGESKPLDGFGKNRSCPDGLQKHCKACRSELAQTVYRERVADYKRRLYLADLERNREVRREYERQHRVEAIERVRKWQRDNPDKKRKHASLTAHKRRAREAGAPFEPVDRDYVYERDGGRCHICDSSVPREEMTLDHLVPVFHGGGYTADNLRVAHLRCNSARGPGRLPAQLLVFG